MPTRLDADRWGDLEILEVAPLDLRAADIPADATWWCGRCGDRHLLAAGSVVKLRSHLGVSEQIACHACAGLARRRALGQRPRRVLLIEDDPDYRDVTRRLLEQEASAEVIGYVDDGREALVEVTRLQPDVVVLDLAMPRLDGLELLPQLPEDLEVIVLSGVTGLRDRCRALRDDVTILHKDRTGLLALVDELAAG